MPDRLFFGDAWLGEVEPVDADFPNLFGTFRPSDATDHPEIRRRIGEYAAYSIAADALMGTDPDAWEAFVAEHEAAFLDLIESPDWWLEDDRGERSAILVPLFGEDSSLVWRWAPDR